MSEIGSLGHYLTRALNSTPTAFARLVFVGSLRDAYTGRYLHEGWGQVATSEEIHATVLEVHQKTFLSVVNLSLIELGKQLRHHFNSLGEAETETILLWLETEPFRELVPQGCSTVLRNLFVLQTRTALEVLHRAPEWEELSAPIALLHPLPDQSPLPHRIN